MSAELLRGQEGVSAGRLQVLLQHFASERALLPGAARDCP